MTHSLLNYLNYISMHCRTKYLSLNLILDPIPEIQRLNSCRTKNMEFQSFLHNKLKFGLLKPCKIVRTICNCNLKIERILIKYKYETNIK